MAPKKATKSDGTKANDKIPIPEDKPISGYDVSIDIDEWYMPNRNGFQQWVGSQFKYTKDQLESDNKNNICPLFPHQHVIKDYLQQASPYRSLLLYQGLGTGKTRASIAVAEVLSSTYKIIVMVPASLEANYQEEIIKCGNDFFKHNGEWHFFSSKNTKAVEYAKSIGITPQSIKRNSGVWLCNKKSSTNNYNTLSLENQDVINAQITDMMKARYRFVRYNGLSMESAKELLIETNSFENCIVIIDEVHNFISRMVNNSKIANIVYNGLKNSPTCKLLLLSGTPLINKPIEISYICNLARGNLLYYNIKLKSVINLSQLKSILDKDKYIDFYEIDIPKNTITIVPLPLGFAWASKNNNTVKQIQTKYDSYDALQEHFEKAISKVVKVAAAKVIKTDLLPTKEEDFETLFIDYDAAMNSKDPVNNKMLLSRRLQGIIAHYESYDKSQFPTLYDTEIIKIDLPDDSLQNYLEVRQKEFKLESKSKQKSAKAQLTKASYYRCLSRALCNFRFPSNIKRPAPGTISLLKNELSEDADDAIDTEKALNEIDEESKLNTKIDSRDKLSKKTDSKTLYESAISDALTKLKRQSDFGTDEFLSKYSPKFLEILSRLQNNEGSAMIYSQFRTVEGLGIFKLVLESRGYCKLDLKREDGKWVFNVPEDKMQNKKYIEFLSSTNSESEREKMRILMNIFNSQFDNIPEYLRIQLEQHDITSNIDGEFVKLIMITQSGAEGISLKNVRTVHILEPYWNNVRIKQVIGRAVRAGSHLALPVHKRNVKVFMYLMKFSESQLKTKKLQAIFTRENHQTSDEYIYTIAAKKSSITNVLLNLLKSVAVDCRLYTHKHEGVACTNIPIGFGKPKDVLYSYKSIDDDPNDAVVKKQIKVNTISKTYGVIKNKKTNNEYYYNKDSGEIFDGAMLKEQNIHRIVGIVENIGGIKKVIWYE